ncbi:lasso peptide biosynthesis B2 protein [Bacillus cereus]|uniref:lasso peptide biosynthesis B2 protein n=1 Tax=Bacillus cereus TaxID=1396 RepID=UPI0024BDA24C|nr:lasso peptide biosynthesis B2 protein [Bacillus cereus]
MLSKINSIYRYIRISLLLVTCDVQLSYMGFSKTFEWYTKKFFLTKKVTYDKESFEKTVNEINELFDVLDIICAWYPRKSDCIHKTLLGYKIIRRKYGVPVDMVVGIRKFPFEAHAWLQYKNQNFFEEETNKYRIILRSNDLRGSE